MDKPDMNFRKTVVAVFLSIFLVVAASAADPVVPPWAFESMTFQLLGLMRGGSALGTGPATASSPHPAPIEGLNPLQAQHLVAILQPWQAKVYLTPAEAKAVWQAEQAILTPEQRAWKPNPVLPGPNRQGNAGGNPSGGQSAFGAGGFSRQGNAGGATGDGLAGGGNRLGGAARAAGQTFESRHLAMIRLVLSGLSRLSGIEDLGAVEPTQANRVMDSQALPAATIAPRTRKTISNTPDSSPSLRSHRSPKP